MGWSQTTVIAKGEGPHRLDSKFFKFLIFLNFNALWGGEGTEGCSDFFYFFEFLENHAFWRVCFVIGDVENRKLQTALQLGHVWLIRGVPPINE